MTEQELRSKFVAKMQSWIGLNEADGSFKVILDTYNSVIPLPRGHKAVVTDEWCAITVSAAGLACAMGAIIPRECSCGHMVQMYQRAGRWVEDDGYIPSPGDVIFYAWKDDGKGDCTKWPQHVGVVERVADGVITVIEGNKGERVDRRAIRVNWRYIRGYGVPDFAALATSGPTAWEGKWYAKSWQWGIDHGITDGTAPERTITRAEVVEMAYRMMTGDK